MHSLPACSCQKCLASNNVCNMQHCSSVSERTASTAPCNSAFEIRLSYICSSNRAVNPLRFGYTNQYVYIPWESNRCKHLNTLYGQNVEFLNAMMERTINTRSINTTMHPFLFQIFLVHVSIVNSHLQAVHWQCTEIRMFLHLQFCNNGVKRYCTDITRNNKLLMYVRDKITLQIV